jgi:tetratricopeptide (TPR) repeat protein
LVLRRAIPDILALAPTTVLAATVFALAWREQGSVLAEDWLAYALGAALLVATVLASGTAVRPRRACLLGLGGLAALAFWTAVSATWSPVPALARDEALLGLFYGLALACPLLTLHSSRQRLAAIAVVVATGVALVIATTVRLLTADGLTDLYWHGRLASPVGYPGAEAAIFLVCFWPATALAASRRPHSALRALAFGGAVALLGGWLMTQSRAGAISLAVSAVVVFAVAPNRLRLLVPVLLAAALVAPSYDALTEPFRAQGGDLDGAIRDAGRWALAISVAGVLVGIAYTLADRAFAVPRRAVRAAGVIVLAALALGAVGGAGAYLVVADNPIGDLQDRWEDFKQEPEVETGSSLLATVGSNRYDFWRVALNEFRDNPLAGAGGRAFGPAYLREGRTDETPRRAHSLELDLLGEAGLVGFLLAAAAFVPFAAIVIRRARSNLVAVGVLGAMAYWFVHASGDWTWTFPAVGLPFLLLLGAGTAGGGEPRLAWPVGPFAGLAVAATALVLFAPPWLSARYRTLALTQGPPEATDHLRWARRLDPLSVDPLVAEAELASSPEQAIAPLLDAVDREPESLAPRYLLGLAYLEAGRPASALRELEEARRLAPRSEAVRRALRRAGEAARRRG